MLATGTFSAPLLRTSVPAGKSILCPRIACRVKDTTININMIYTPALAPTALLNVNQSILLIPIRRLHPLTVFVFF